MNEQTQNDGGPFAPYFKRMETIDGVTNLDLVHGCTMRDYFAAQALTGWFASFAGATNDHINDFMTDWDHSAKSAYKMADAMLKARAAK